MISSLFSHVYDRVRSGINYSYSLFYRKDPLEDLMKKIEMVEKNLFSQMATLSSKVEQTQSDLHQAIDKIDRTRERESIAKCYNYAKKINDLLTAIMISLPKIPSSHKCSCTCQECVYTQHVKGYKESLLKVQRYIQLTIPHVYNFRDIDIRCRVVNVLKDNSVQEGIDVLASLKEESKPYICSIEESCNKIHLIVDKFKSIFTNIREEIKQVNSYLDKSIS